MMKVSIDEREYEQSLGNSHSDILRLMGEVLSKLKTRLFLLYPPQDE